MPGRWRRRYTQFLLNGGGTLFFCCPDSKIQRPAVAGRQVLTDRRVFNGSGSPHFMPLKTTQALSVATLLTTLLNSTPVFPAAFGVAIEGGVGDDIEAKRMGAAIQSDWGMPSFTWGNWQLASFWEVSASHWEADPSITGVGSLAQYGFTPFIRLRPVRPLLLGLQPFIEAGIGVSGLTEDRFNVKHLGTEFAFGNHGGMGLSYGNFDISYRFQHLSNAGLVEANSGMNFHLFRVGYHF